MKILILAQTPPPFHGQSIMLKYLVEAKWNWCEKIFIRLNFSKSIKEIGNFNISKIFHLCTVVYKVWKMRLKGKIDVLFYPPTGPHKVPFYRDLITLLLIRWCTNKIIFHFHAGGFDVLYNKLNLFEKFLALKAYINPAAAIILLSNFENEIKWINPDKIFVVPNGVEDHHSNQHSKKNNREISILSVGIISEQKGILTSIETAKILKDKSIKFKWNFIGNFYSNKIKKETETKIYNYDLNKYVNFINNISGEAKYKFYSKADIFCFPSFENETMPLVLLEAMMMSLPIIATNWRGIPAIIDDTKNGLLVPAKDPSRLAESIEMLINNAELRINLGIGARKKFLREFTIEKHLKKMENIFKEIAYGSE